MEKTTKRLLLQLSGLRDQGGKESDELYHQALREESEKRDQWDASYLSGRYPARVLARATAARFRQEGMRGGISASIIASLMKIAAALTLLDGEVEDVEDGEKEGPPAA